MESTNDTKPLPPPTLIERLTQIEAVVDSACARIEHLSKRLNHLLIVLENRVGYTDLDYDNLPTAVPMRPVEQVSVYRDRA